MIIIMNSGATGEQIDSVVNKIKSFGLDANVSRGTERTVIGAIGAAAHAYMTAME